MNDYEVNEYKDENEKRIVRKCIGVSKNGIKCTKWTSTLGENIYCSTHNIENKRIKITGICQGDMKDGKLNGNCKIVGSTYDFEGSYENGYMKFGKLKHKSSNKEYIGEFDRNYISGKGKMVYSNGFVLEAIFDKSSFVESPTIKITKNNLFEFIGKSCYPIWNNPKYNSLQRLIGKITHNNNEIECSFTFDLQKIIFSDFHITRVKYSNGDIFTKLNYPDKFHKTFELGFFCSFGFCNYNFKNGDKYVGEYIWNNKDRSWFGMSQNYDSEAIFYGNGTLTKVNGNIKTGIWKNGMFQELEELEIANNEQNICKICINYAGNMLLAPCNHIGYCEECCNKIDKCPECRGNITKRIKTFR